MWNFVIRSLWARKVYTVLMLLALTAGGSGWGIFSSALQTTQYVVNENLDLYWRTTYDLLVRPRGALATLEENYGLLEPNYLSNTYTGGITRQQYEAIKRIPGVEVAAAIAPVGFLYGGSPNIYVRLPMIPPNWQPESGSPPPATIYNRIYRLHTQTFVNNGLQTFLIGENERYYVNLPAHLACCPPIRSADQRVFYISSFELSLGVAWKLIIPVVGIDPEEEARLLHLDATITSGRYLHPDDRPREEDMEIPLPSGESKVTILPVLVNGAPYLNVSTQVRLEQYSLPEDFDPLSIPSDQLVNFLQNVPTTLLMSDTLSPQTAVQAFLGGHLSETMGRYRIEMGTFLAQGLDLLLPSPVSYQALSEPQLPASFVLEVLPQGKTDYGEVIFRQITTLQPESLRQTIRLEQVGVYDPARLGITLTGLVDVPLEIYYPPFAFLKYAPDGTPLPPRLMRPTMNAPISYLLPPPYALVTLDTAQWLSGREDFIHAIRIRVTGTEQRNVKSQALVEAVAAEIEHQTGLHVDITLGSSLNRTLVYIPGYEDIPPLGYVEEGWVVQGANLSISHRVNWVNLVLLLTALVTFSGAVAILVASSIMARTRQWSLLHALGWRSSAIRAAVLLEVGLVGGASGLLATGISLAISHWLRLNLTWGHFLSIPPVTVLLSLLASLYALRQVNITRPITTIRRETAPHLRWRIPLSSLWALSLRGLIERGGLSTLGYLMLTATTTLFVILLGLGADLERFLGTTRLGEHLLGLAGWYYYLLLAIGVVVSGIGIAELILTEVRRRRSEIGVLLATGWRNVHILWIFIGQAALLGMFGGLSGSLFGITLLKILASEGPLWWPLALGIGMMFALAISVASAVHPAHQATKMPPAEAIRYE